jgi:hypothetical protein
MTEKLTKRSVAYATTATYDSQTRCTYEKKGKKRKMRRLPPSLPDRVSRQTDCPKSLCCGDYWRDPKQAGANW